MEGQRRSVKAHIGDEIITLQKVVPCVNGYVVWTCRWNLEFLCVCVCVHLQNEKKFWSQTQDKKGGVVMKIRLFRQIDI